MKNTILAIIGLIIIIGAVIFFTKGNGMPQNELTPLIEDVSGITSEPLLINNQPIEDELNMNETNPMTTYHIEMNTNKGLITLELDSAKTPKTVANFVKLAKEGFYDGTRFHRVIEGFMIQGGDPQSKDVSLRSRWGTGGPDYRFDDELDGTEKYPQGTLAMANAGPNTNGSQFFIVTANPAPLPPSYTVFGKVISGMDVALAIEKVDTTKPGDQPVEDVIVKTVKVLEK